MENQAAKYMYHVRAVCDAYCLCTFVTMCTSTYAHT